MKPGRNGLTLAVRHLPALASAFKLAQGRSPTARARMSRYLAVTHKRRCGGEKSPPLSLTQKSILPRGGLPRLTGRLSMARQDKRGRSKSKDRFAHVPIHVMQSAAYSLASLPARCVLFEVAALFVGGNNGKLGLSVRQASERLRCSKDTASRAFRDLVARLARTDAPGTLRRQASPEGERMAVDGRKCDKTGSLPSHAYQRWKPPPEETTDTGKTKTGPTRGTVRSDGKDSSAKMAA